MAEPTEMSSGSQSSEKTAETGPTQEENTGNLCDLGETAKPNEHGEPSGVSEVGLNCYCGKDRNLNIVELLCANCSKWFHESCISFQLGKLIPFLSNYIFLCKNCSPTGLEIFKKFQAQINQMCISAIANLQQNCAKDGSHRLMFSKEKEIIPFIETRWESITIVARRVTQSWHATVHRALIKEVHLLFVSQDCPINGQMFGLLCNDLTQIRPNYEAMIKGGLLRVTEAGIMHVPVTGTSKSRNTKRKSDGAGRRGRHHLEFGIAKLPPHGYPLDHPFNKDGYRYFLAEPDPHAPFRQEFDESNNWAGKPIPGWLYRVLLPNTVLLALHDRAPQLKISEDRLAVTGDKGYCTVRASHSVNQGSWYWEATIEDMPVGAAVRLGWGQDYSNLQAPLGYDKFGYSWRSKKGTRFHQAIGKHYSPGYGQGDTLGFLIVLPEASSMNVIPNTYKDRPLVKFKNHLYYEDKDNVAERVKKLKTLPGSKIVFFKNGVSQGEAFKDIFSGSYHPGLSLHKNTTVSVNFGPNFKYPPSMDECKWRGVHERCEETICEQTYADMLYLMEHEGRLRLDSFVL